VLARPAHDAPLEEDARVALASALLLLGVPEADAVVRAAVVGPHASMSPVVGRVAVAAFGESGGLAAIAAEVVAQSPGLLAETVAALARTGQLEVASRLEGGAAAGKLAHLARVALIRDGSNGASPSVVHWMREAEAAEGLLATYYEEGLVSHAELFDARLELAQLRAALGDREAARAAVRQVAAELRASVDEAGATLFAHLREVAGGTRGPMPPAEGRWFEPAGEGLIEKAIAGWEAASDMRRWFRARRHASTLLQAAAALARRGETARARTLIARVLDPLEKAHDSMPSLLGGALVTAWIACGDLARAEAHAASGSWLSVDERAALALGLAEAGRVADALPVLRAAFESVDRSDLFTLAPAVLAVARNRRVAAQAMIGALVHADALLLTLSL
jgi:hypothetical protein